ncbi:MAG: hypothetical protein ABEH86_04460 [Haloarcula sp.]
MSISHRDAFFGVAAAFLLLAGGWFLRSNQSLLGASMLLSGAFAVVVWQQTRGQPVQV